MSDTSLGFQPEKFKVFVRYMIQVAKEKIIGVSSFFKEKIIDVGSFFVEKRTDTKKHARKLMLRETTQVLPRRATCGHSGRASSTPGPPRTHRK